MTPSVSLSDRRQKFENRPFVESLKRYTKVFIVNLENIFETALADFSLHLQMCGKA